MNVPPKIDMIEATRLTRLGRLSEATALLRRGFFAPGPAADGDDSTFSATGPTAPTLDLVPSKEMEGPWTLAPNLAEQPLTDRPTGIKLTRRPTATPHFLRSLLDRFQTRTANELKGPITPAARRLPLSIPSGARFEERVFANEAGSRTYKLYVPSSYKGQALPLVVMLHGCSQSPDDFAAGTRMNELAEEQIFFVAYPEQLPAANASKCWNWFSTNDQKRGRGEPSLIAGITLQVMSEFPVISGRVFVAGMSAGGAAAAIMGSTYPDLYAAIGIHSGLACGAASDLPSAFSAMRQGSLSASRVPRQAVPTIVFHGDHDATVNPINAAQIIAQCEAVPNLQITVNKGSTAGGLSYTHVVKADQNGRSVLEQWTVHGVGHAWSGGSVAGSYTEPRGPDASREMLRFFLEQHRA
jgi:poly(hydroxyalkanoate) depolymerase family esterase